MNGIRSFLKKLWVETHGQDLIEYALMAGFVAVAIAALLPNVVGDIKIIFDKVIAALGGVAYVAIPVLDSTPAWVRIISAVLAIVCIGMIVLRRNKNPDDY